VPAGASRCRIGCEHGVFPRLIVLRCVAAASVPRACGAACWRAVGRWAVPRRRCQGTLPKPRGISTAARRAFASKRIAIVGVAGCASGCGARDNFYWKRRRGSGPTKSDAPASPSASPQLDAHGARHRHAADHGGGIGVSMKGGISAWMARSFAASHCSSYRSIAPWDSTTRECLGPRAVGQSFSAYPLLSIRRIHRSSGRLRRRFASYRILGGFTHLKSEIGASSAPRSACVAWAGTGLF